MSQKIISTIVVSLRDMCRERWGYSGTPTTSCYLWLKIQNFVIGAFLACSLICGPFPRGVAFWLKLCCFTICASCNVFSEWIHSFFLWILSRQPHAAASSEGQANTKGKVLIKFLYGFLMGILGVLWSQAVLDGSNCVINPRVNHGWHRTNSRSIFGSKYMYTTTFWVYTHVQNWLHFAGSIYYHFLLTDAAHLCQRGSGGNHTSRWFW